MKLALTSANLPKSQSFTQNFERLKQRGCLEKILHVILASMNDELNEQMTRYIESGEEVFIFSKMASFREDLASTCSVVCDDILQHLYDFIQLEHPQIVLDINLNTQKFVPTTTSEVSVKKQFSFSSKIPDKNGTQKISNRDNSPNYSEANASKQQSLNKSRIHVVSPQQKNSRNHAVMSPNKPRTAATIHSSPSKKILLKDECFQKTLSIKNAANKMNNVDLLESSRFTKQSLNSTIFSSQDVSQQMSQRGVDVSSKQKVRRHKFISLKSFADQLRGREKTQFLNQMVPSTFSMLERSRSLSRSGSFSKSPRFKQ